MTLRTKPCVVCGASRWEPLPDPARQSMTSDWRIIPEPLARRACGVCGLAVREPHGVGFYARGYQLYAHAPGEARESERQAAYAGAITERIGRAPQRILDVGCGNGSLLRALAGHWPGAELFGCDPSAESVQHGTGAGLRLWQGTSRDLPPGFHADLIVSVNVIEHTSDPRAFVRDLGRALAPDGRLLLICPDGGRPGVELLFSDHLFSFTSGHLRALLAREGLRTTSSGPTPAALGAFQINVAKRGEEAVPAPAAEARLLEERRSYLAAWGDLDERLAARVVENAVCFGAAETAGLLRAYAPMAWARVRACTFDGASGGAFGELRIKPLDRISPDTPILLGVRPADQPAIARRLRTRFHQVVTWYDLVDR